MKKGLVVLVAVCAATAAMAFGVGSASAATVICETSSATCTHPYPNGSKFEVVGTARLEGFPGSVSCFVNWEFEIGVNKKPVVQARVLWWELTSCTGHTVTTLNPPWTTWLTTTGGGNGIGEIEPWVGLPFKIDGCEYEQGTIPMEIQGGGWLTDSGVLLTRHSGSCPATLTMTIPSSKPIPMFWMEN
jgi:hypothetical protein